ncbi:MAG: DUF2244 domain-containing protein [Gammaproteobacteria bacterium]
MIYLTELSENNYRIELKPNYSLVGFQRVLFFAVIVTTCLSIAAFFWYLGAKLILPFAGLEIGLVGLGFYLNFRWSSQREIIFINQQKVIVEKGRIFKDFSYEEYRTFVRFQAKTRYNGDIALSLSSKGQYISLGNFLAQEEILELKEMLLKIVAKLNTLAPGR